MSGQLLDATADLYSFVATFERLDARTGVLPQLPKDLPERARSLRDRLRQAAAPTAGRLAARLQHAASDLQALARTVEARTPTREELRQHWRALSASYEALHTELRGTEAAGLPRLKPRNFSRNVFHVSSGLIGVISYELIGNRLWVAALCASIFFAFVSLDLLRKFSPSFNERLVEGVFGRISRPHEHLQVPSAIWYVGALMVGVVWLPAPAIEVGALVLAFGDPAASLVGKRFGKRKVVGQKTWLGSATFLGVGLAVAMLCLLVVAPGLSLAVVLRVSLGAALAGAIAELFTGPFDDNLTVPLAASLVAALLL